MNGKTAKALKRKSVANTKETYGTATANLCQKEYKRLKKLIKDKSNK